MASMMLLLGRDNIEGEGENEPDGGESERRNPRRRVWGVREASMRASAPCLFFQSMQRGKWAARSWATDSEISTASWRGVSQFALRLIPSSSWPASMRNSCIYLQRRSFHV